MEEVKENELLAPPAVVASPRKGRSLVKKREGGGERKRHSKKIKNVDLADVALLNVTGTSTPMISFPTFEKTDSQ